MMTRRVWIAISIVAALNFALAWLNWMTLSFFINLPEYHQTAFYALTTFALGFYCGVYGRGLKDWSAAPLAALFGTTLFTLLVEISGSFAVRELSGWMILIYTWFETVLAVVCGLAGIGAAYGLRRLRIARSAT